MRVTGQITFFGGEGDSGDVKQKPGGHIQEKSAGHQVIAPITPIKWPVRDIHRNKGLSGMKPILDNLCIPGSC